MLGVAVGLAMCKFVNLLARCYCLEHSKLLLRYPLGKLHGCRKLQLCIFHISENIRTIGTQ